MKVYPGELHYTFEDDVGGMDKLSKIFKRTNDETFYMRRILGIKDIEIDCFIN
jgi:hypothetical protein